MISSTLTVDSGVVHSNGLLLRDFLVWLKFSKGVTPRTLYSYRRVLQALLLFVGSRELADVSTETLQGWVVLPRHKRAGKQPAAATIQRDVAVLRTFFRWCVHSGVLVHSPAELLVAPPIKGRKPKPVSDAVWRKVWESPLSDGERVFLGLGFFAGLRREELTALRRFHVDMSFGKTRLVGFVRKGGGDDIVPLETMVRVFAKRLPQLLPDQTMFWRSLRQLADGDREGFLLPWKATASVRGAYLDGLAEGQLDPQFLNRLLDKICKRTNVSRFTPHQMRHSTATNLLRAGVPLHIVSRMLNHSSVQVTMGYAKAGQDELAEWLDNVD